VKIETGFSVYAGSFKISAQKGKNKDAAKNFNQVITNLPFLPSQITFVADTNIEDLTTDTSIQDQNNSVTIKNTRGSMHGFVRNNGTANFLQNVIFIAAHRNSINNV
jgi:hypothetical protein